VPARSDQSQLPVPAVLRVCGRSQALKQIGGSFFMVGQGQPPLLRCEPMALVLLFTGRRRLLAALAGATAIGLNFLSSTHI
jgi:hypothetical protein